MGLLDDLISHEANLLQDTDGMGESIGYTPYGLSEITITAIVNREPPKRDTESPNAASNVLEIFIRRDANGVKGPASVQAGGDRVSVAKVYGESATTLRVRKVLSSDAAGWLLEVG